MITFKQLQEKLSDKEYKEVDALLNRDTLLRGNLIKNYAQRGKFETMKARDTFRRIKKNEDGKLRIDRGTENKIKVNRHTVSKNFPELSKKPVEKYKKYYRLPESVAALALKGGSKLIPALMTGIGAAGTILQAKRKYRTRLNPGKRNSGRVLSPAEKKIFDKSQRDTDQKVTDQKPRDKVVKKILDRNAKKNQERMKIPNRIQSDRRRLLRGIAKGEVMLDQYYPTEEVDFVQYIKDRFKEKGLSGFVRPKKVEKKKKTIGDLLKNLNTNTNEEMMAVPTNNASGDAIAGLPPDSPPVKKKKRYIYGGRGSRKMWMNNK